MTASGISPPALFSENERFMSFSALKFLFAAGFAFALGACATSPMVTRPAAGLEVIRNQALPSPSAINMAPQPDGFVLGPMDKIQINVFGLEELSVQETQVDSGGYVGVPLVGSVRAAGLSPAELGAAIAAGLRTKGVRNPQVAIGLTEQVSQVVAVEGEVRDPGIFVVEGQMTLMRAIAKAKGLTEFARTNEVLVFRNVGDQKLVGVYDLRALRGGTYEDPRVYANDLVVVGDSPARRRFKTLVEGAALLTPLIYLLQ